MLFVIQHKRSLCVPSDDWGEPMNIYVLLSYICKCTVNSRITKKKMAIFVQINAMARQNDMGQKKVSLRLTCLSGKTWI